MQKKQMAFGFGDRLSFSSRDFLQMPSNQEALKAIQHFPTKEPDILVLYGAEGVGKTHLLNIWCERSGDRVVDAESLVDVPFNLRKVAVDNLEKAGRKEQENLFYLFNHIVSEGGAMLVASRQPVAQMDLIPELRSRLLTGVQIEVQTPEESQLEVLLVKMAADKQIDLDPAVLKYLLNHCERSPAALRHMLNLIDQSSLEQKRKITIPLVKEILSGL